MIKNKNKNIYRAIILIYIALIFLIALNTSFAATVNVNNSTADGGIKQGLNTANPNDILLLSSGKYVGINNTGITINKSVIIRGDGPINSVIIDGEKHNRLFYINANNITFINIMFINGNSTNDGGAILNNYGVNITFINCGFINNTAAGYGGAVCNNALNLKVINSTFINNACGQTSHSGGAIRNQGNNLTLINSNFTNNSASGGGAVFSAYCENTSLTNCTFNNNTATSYGGAIMYSSYNFTVINCTFNNNTATWGAAIMGQKAYDPKSNGLTIINSNFINNTATVGAGGAIYNDIDNYTIINSNFINNTAVSYGGAIHNYGNNFKITNSTFTNNSLTDFISHGGAIYNNGNDLIIINSNFTNNEVEYRGGAIYNNGNATITDSKFIDNKADDNGGAIYNGVRGNLYLSRNIMANNSAILGQMIYNAGNMGNLKLIYLNNSTINVLRGQNIVLFVILTDDMGNTITGQNISFYVNGTFMGTVESIEGYANITYTIPNVLGLIPVIGDYGGHNGYDIGLFNGELNIIKIPTNSTINVINNPIVGNKTIINGILTDKDGNIIGGVELTVSVGNETFKVITDIDGVWNLTYTPLSPDNFIVIVSWIGDDVYEEFENNTSFNAIIFIPVPMPTPELNPEPIPEPIPGLISDPSIEPSPKFNPELSPTSTPEPISKSNTELFSEPNNENNSVASATMKETGMPIIAIFLAIFLNIGFVYRKKE